MTCRIFFSVNHLLFLGEVFTDVLHACIIL